MQPNISYTVALHGTSHSGFCCILTLFHLSFYFKHQMMSV